MRLKIKFITNICHHHVIKLFELLADKYDAEIIFTGGYENYLSSKDKESSSGNFKARKLNGFFLFPKIKITLGLFVLFFEKTDVFIKTMDDRFALLCVFFISRILRKPLILWTGIWHHPQTLTHKLTYWLTKFIYKNSDAIITYGKHVKNYLVSLGIKEDKIFCAMHSLDNSSFDKYISVEEKNNLKRKLNIENNKIILYVGRIDKCKGLDYLVDAVSKIKLSNISVLFIGKGEYKDTLEEKCKASKIKYIFLGYVHNKELFRYYAIADIFILPSITTDNFKEPWGLVVNEAMNQGCPAIVTNAVGAAGGGLVEDGINGIIIPEKNSEEIRKAMEKLLTDDKLWRSMAQAGREKVKEYTPEQTYLCFMQAIDYAVNKTKG
ncbi:MAG: glycosyltransferase family 4 protein [Candidatus Omnitrophica bacterium]|nr:glycosyltransferase family 4 protein [Candidatus Omnitrophota bacterium]MDD5352363.1 glycosyltransferase family 4 protein [Candidatus Omnitrophota bacterium]MDD5549961.1 glycosyltransferase family 4 protein [Candidatus Omnitrophota bacterium]